MEFIYQAALLHDKGEELGNRVTMENVCVLYLLENFYVEVVFDAYVEKYIEIVAFMNSDRLDKYLDLNHEPLVIKPT